MWKLSVVLCDEKMRKARIVSFRRGFVKFSFVRWLRLWLACTKNEYIVRMSILGSMSFSSTSTIQFWPKVLAVTNFVLQSLLLHYF